MSLITLQQEIGTKPDGIFGRNTIASAAKHFNLNRLQAIHFFAQCSHETAEFKLFEENLNYSKSALKRVFRRHFKDEELEFFDRNPKAIANRVYSNRMGNGDEMSGDGWKYRGRGAIQLTGKTNYVLFSKFKNDVSIVSFPDIVKHKYAFDSAIFFFNRNNLWRICNEGLEEDVVKKLTRRINGGLNGIQHRLELTEKYSKLI